MTLAETTLGDRLRRALEAGNGRTPELLTGDLTGLELEAAPPAGLPRRTGPSRRRCFQL